MRRIIATAITVLMSGSVLAQSNLKGNELVGFHATIVATTVKRCGGEMARELANMTDLGDVDFKFGMTEAIFAARNVFAGDLAAACAAMQAKYGPTGSDLIGGWLPPKR